MKFSNGATFVSQQSSSSELRPTTPSKRAPIMTFVTITETVTPSTTKAIHTIFTSSDSPLKDSHSIQDAAARLSISSLPSSTFQPLVSSPLHVNTTALVPFTTLGPIPTREENAVTLVTASTDSLGVYSFVTATSPALFQPNHPSSTPEKDMNTSDDDSSLDTTMVILIVLGTIAVCSLVLLSIWWYKGRRPRPRDSDMYRFSEKPGNFVCGEIFRRALGKRTYSGVGSNPRKIKNPFIVGSVGNNHERTTPTPFPEQISKDVILIGRPGLSSPHVRFQKLAYSDSESDSEDVIQHRIGECTTEYDRPPTYYTNSTGLATIATTLPQYSTVEPSPISERSDTSTTLTLSTPMPLTFKGRGFGRPLARFPPGTLAGKKI